MMARRGGGRLIAIEGFDIRALRARARTCARRAGRGSGVSFLDASGIFTELAAADDQVEPASPRTAILLYAADLAFRVRWQIEPALAEGKTVIAAPYVATAIALGRAAGVPNEWVSEVLRFAPPPTVTENLARRRSTDERALSDLLVPARRHR